MKTHPGIPRRVVNQCVSDDRQEADMASNADSNAAAPDSQANEQDAQVTRLQEDLDDRLDALRDRTELCNTILRDLADLRVILADKNISDRTIQSTQEEHIDMRVEQQ